MRNRQALICDHHSEHQGIGALESLAFIALLFYCVEIIAGGPGLWRLGPVPIRKTLFVVVLAALSFCCLGRRYRMLPGTILLVAAIGLFLGIWMVLIPGAHDLNQVGLAAMDASSFLIVIAAALVHEFLRRHPEYWAPLLSAIVVSLSFAAAANIALWLIGFSSAAGNELAQWFGLSWFTLGNSGADPSLYIGPMPDGFFRAMWITAIMYVPALLFSVARRKWWSTILFAVALFASYTRSLWLVAALGLVFAQFMSSRNQPFIRPKVVVLTLVACGLAGVLLAGTLPLASFMGLAIDRLWSTFSDVSAQERFEQIAPLLMQWERAPILGSGFGASSILIRSEEAPYSYELTGLALLMKLGIVGVLSLLVLFATIWARALPVAEFRTPAQCAALASIVALIGAGLTNPLLLNSVGFSVLSFLFLFLFLSKEGPDVG